MLKQAFKVLKAIGCGVVVIAVVAAIFAVAGAITWLLSWLAQWIVSLTNETTFHLTPAVNTLAAATAITVIVLLIGWFALAVLPTTTIVVSVIACIAFFFWSRVHLFPGTPVSGFLSQVAYSLSFAVVGLAAFCAVILVIVVFSDEEPDDEQTEDDLVLDEEDAECSA
jgi:hypothetical protein